MLESLFNKFAGPEAYFHAFFTEQVKWLLLIILNYIVLYQTGTAHLLSRRINSTLYEFS